MCVCASSCAYRNPAHKRPAGVEGKRGERAGGAGWPDGRAGLERLDGRAEGARGRTGGIPDGLSGGLGRPTGGRSGGGWGEADAEVGELASVDGGRRVRHRIGA